MLSADITILFIQCHSINILCSDKKIYLCVTLQIPRRKKVSSICSHNIKKRVVERLLHHLLISQISYKLFEFTPSSSINRNLCNLFIILPPHVSSFIDSVKAFLFGRILLHLFFKAYTTIYITTT